MKIPKLIFFVLFFLHLYGFGQSDSLVISDSVDYNYYKKKDIALITGYQIHGNHYAEIGLGVIRDVVSGNHLSTIIYGVSNEFKISNNFVWGFKSGLWMGGGVAGMNMGLNLINYTDFKENTLRFRPEIGFGINVFRVVYGYNCAITNKDFVGINQHNFALNILFKLKTLKIEKR